MTKYRIVENELGEFGVQELFSGHWRPKSIGYARIGGRLWGTEIEARQAKAKFEGWDHADRQRNTIKRVVE